VEWFSSLRLRLHALLRRSHREGDLEDEIAFHLAMRADQLRASGAADADAGAKRRFGSPSRIGEEMRDAWAVMPRMSHLIQDFRYAVRALSRSGTFAVIVMVTLGLGIGANTGVFSIVNAALIRPLGFVQPDRLIMLHEGVPAAGIDRVPFSPGDLQDVQREVQSLHGVGAFRTASIELSGSRGEPERIQATKVTAGLFPLLGVEPALGRLFSAAEDRPGNDLAVISWALWQRRYAGAPSLIGQSILLDRRPYTVIGIMPPTLEFPRRGLQFNGDPGDVWIPMATAPWELRRGGGFTNSTIGRLREGATLQQLQAELDVLAPRVQEQYPGRFRNRDVAPLLFFATSLREELVGSVESPMLMLLGAIGVVLLVVCANVANLLLSRVAARQPEIGVRVALGATRLRLLQMQLSEAILLSVSGGVLGLVVARLALDAVPAVVVDRVPGLQHVEMDLRVFGFTAGLSVLTAVLVAVVPLFATKRGTLEGAGREGAKQATLSGRRHRIQSGLVISTVALSFVLLVGAGLFLRSFSAQLARDRGFQPAGVMTLSVALPQEGYGTAARVRSFHDALLRRAGTLPGARAAALGTSLPLESGTIVVFYPEGADTGGIIPPTRRTWVQGDYFGALGMSLARGRGFTADEQAADRQVAIVNEKLATRYWPGVDPIGKRIRFGPPESRAPWLSIVGIVKDAVDGVESVATMGDDQPVQVYEPLRQIPDAVLASSGAQGRDLRLAVRADRAPALLARPVRAALTELDAQLAVARIATMEDRLGDVLAPQRFSTTLVTAFAAGALLLVSVGLYGLLASVVTQRRREIGVRLALGAAPRSVLRSIVGRGLQLVLVGIGVGTFFALGAVRWLSAFLYDTPAYDPLTFVAVPIVLLAVAALACFIPAQRASRLDPLVTLRAD